MLTQSIQDGNSDAELCPNGGWSYPCWLFLEVALEGSRVESSWYNRSSPICSALGCSCTVTTLTELVVCYLS